MPSYGYHVHFFPFKSALARGGFIKDRSVIEEFQLTSSTAVSNVIEKKDFDDEIVLPRNEFLEI